MSCTDLVLSAFLDVFPFILLVKPGLRAMYRQLTVSCADIARLADCWKFKISGFTA
jgi:hypothetical protein